MSTKPAFSESNATYDFSFAGASIPFIRTVLETSKIASAAFVVICAVSKRLLAPPAIRACTFTPLPLNPLIRDDDDDDDDWCRRAKSRDTEEETDENREVVLYLFVSYSLKRNCFVPLFTTTRALLLEVVGDAEEVVKMSRARIFVLVVVVEKRSDVCKRQPRIKKTQMKNALDFFICCLTCFFSFVSTPPFFPT